MSYVNVLINRTSSNVEEPKYRGTQLDGPKLELEMAVIVAQPE